MLVMEIVEVERLFKQQSRIRTIRNLQTEIDIIVGKLSSPSGVHLTDMPKNQNPFDKTGMLISRKIEKEKKLEAITKEAQSEGAILEGIINRIADLPEPVQGACNSTYQDLLRYHYLNDFSMKEILDFVGVDDESDNYESQLRLLYLRRYEALKKFIKCQKI
jgi:hypothetical protein